MTPSGPRLTGWMCSPFVHPLLFAAHPVLFAYAHNPGAVVVSDVARPLAADLCGTAALLLLLRRFRRGTFRGDAIALSTLILLFLGYGCVSRIIPRSCPIPPTACWLGLLAIALFGVLRLRYDRALATRCLNVASLAMMLMPLVSIVVTNAGSSGAAAACVGNDVEEDAQAWVSRAAARSDLPDIYYIILDGYGRQDVLKEVFHEDISEFVGTLTRKGFYVVPRARSNYAQTLLSLASSLNMTHITHLSARPGTQSADQSPLRELITANRVCRSLHSMGYSVHVLEDRTRYVPAFGEDRVSAGHLNLLERELYVASSPLSALPRTAATIGQALHSKTLSGLASQVAELSSSSATYTLDHITSVRRTGHPIFVFAHVLCPHPPFVLDRNGNKREVRADGFASRQRRDEDASKDYVTGYADQVAFVSARMEAVVASIQASSPRPPVIIIQGDHGPKGSEWLPMAGRDASAADAEPVGSHLWQSMSILNAIHLPGSGNAALYPDITPVNTFRVVFNTCFGAKYDLLPDSSYFSASHPYDFIPYDPNHVAP